MLRGVSYMVYKSGKMKPPWAGKRRDANEKEIVDALRQAGASVERLHLPVDLMVGYRGVTYLMEVKSEIGSSLTPAELEFCATWRGHWVCVRDVEGALLAIRAIT